MMEGTKSGACKGTPTDIDSEHRLPNLSERINAQSDPSQRSRPRSSSAQRYPRLATLAIFIRLSKQGSLLPLEPNFWTGGRFQVVGYGLGPLDERGSRDRSTGLAK